MRTIQRTFVLFHPSLRSGKRIQLSPDDYLAKILLVMVWGSRVAVFLFFFLFPFFIQAADSVVINEIAWMGTLNSANDEWVELYNNTGNSINLDGWQLVAQDGTPKIKLSGVFPANGFYLLERTDDNAVPKISADKIYTGALGNNGENLELYDASGNLIDSINCTSGWFGGDNKTKKTMERKNSQSPGSHPANWQTSQNPGGTPKAKNSVPTPKEQLPKKEEMDEKLVFQKETVNHSLSEKGTTTPESSNSLFAPIAATIAIFSGTTILILKNKLKTSYNKNIAKLCS